MTDNEKEDVNWLGFTKSKSEMEPAFELDKTLRKVIVNENNIMLKEIARALHKYGQGEYAAGIYAGLGYTYLLKIAKDMGPDVFRVFRRAVWKDITKNVKYICEDAPDIKEKRRTTSKQRYANGGKVRALISAHKRNPPDMHYQCPVCNPGSGYTEEMYTIRSKHWRTLFAKNGFVNKIKGLRDYLKKQTGLKILDGDNIDIIWEAYKNSPYDKHKKARKKYPKDNESLVELHQRNNDIDDENQGRVKLPIRTTDKELQKSDEACSLYIHTFRNERLNFSNHDSVKVTVIFEGDYPKIYRETTDAEMHTWMKVAKNYGYRSDDWEMVKYAVLDYCKENDLQYDKIVTPREYKVDSKKEHKHDGSNAAI